MKQRIAPAALVLLIAHGALAEPELSGTPTELRQHLDTLPGQVTISGLAERTVEADRAVVQVSVLTSERDLKPALQQNSKIRADMVAKLMEAGVDTNRIHTSRFSSTPVHSSWTGKVKEYQTRSTVRVNAESEKEIQLVAGLVDSIDNVSLSSLTFEMTKKDEITIGLLKEAFQRVQERRALYETSLGVRLRPRQVGIPAAKGADRRAQSLLQDDWEITSVAGVLTNPELSVVLHAWNSAARRSVSLRNWCTKSASWSLSTCFRRQTMRSLQQDESTLSSLTRRSVIHDGCSAGRA